MIEHISVSNCEELMILYFQRRSHLLKFIIFTDKKVVEAPAAKKEVKSEKTDTYWLKDFEDAKLQVKVGDKVIFVDFMQSASKMVVMLNKHKHFEEPIMEVMLDEFPKQKSISIKEIGK